MGDDLAVEDGSVGRGRPTFCVLGVCGVGDIVPSVAIPTWASSLPSQSMSAGAAAAFSPVMFLSIWGSNEPQGRQRPSKRRTEKKEKQKGDEPAALLQTKSVGLSSNEQKERDQRRKNKGKVPKNREGKNSAEVKKERRTPSREFRK
jgi:hypothetical protein